VDGIALLDGCAAEEFLDAGQTTAKTFAVQDGESLENISADISGRLKALGD
jgi:hypothetical protein